MTRWIPALLGALALVGCTPEPEPEPVDSSPTDPPSPVVTVTTYGTPMWRVSEVLLFSGPAGGGTSACLLNGPHSFDGSVWAPGTAHEPPYSLRDDLDGCGLELAGDLSTVEPVVFDAADMTSPNGIWLVAMVTPNPEDVDGSSPDFPLGDVIYDDRFPMVVDADVRRGEPIVDAEHDFVFPKPEQWGFVVTGHSHVPMAFSTSLERMPAGATAPGEYTWNLSVRDATSINTESGYDVVVPYTVVGE